MDDCFEGKSDHRACAGLFRIAHRPVSRRKCASKVIRGWWPALDDNGYPSAFHNKSDATLGGYRRVQIQAALLFKLQLTRLQSL